MYYSGLESFQAYRPEPRGGDSERLPGKIPARVGSVFQCAEIQVDSEQQTETCPRTSMFFGGRCWFFVIVLKNL